MKAPPFQLYLRSLVLGAVRPGLVSQSDALVKLRRLTGEDFGDDVERWRAWGKAHPEVSGMWPDDDPEPDSGDGRSGPHGYGAS
jgi:hypothetical protein